MHKFLVSFSFKKNVLYTEAAYDKKSTDTSDPFCVADNANDVQVQSTPLDIYTYFPSISLCTLIRNRFIVNNAYVVLLYYVLLDSLHLQSVELFDSNITTANISEI